jgi:hypothetical protein
MTKEELDDLVTSSHIADKALSYMIIDPSVLRKLVKALRTARVERDGYMADLVRCRRQRDETTDILRQAQIEAGSDGKPIGVTKLRQERDDLAAEVAEWEAKAKREGWLSPDVQR